MQFMKPIVQKIFTSLSLLLTVAIISSMVLVPGVSQAAPVTQESGEDSASKVYLPMVAVVGEAETAATPLLPEQYNAESEEAPTLSADQVQGATCYTNIKFTNSSSYPVSIYWVNYSGGETLYKTLSSGKYYWQQTYYGHSWRVRSASGALLKSFSVYTCSLVYITISNSDFPQPTATPTPASLPLVQCPAGTQSLLVNGSFEQPVISNPYASLNQSSVPGWRTHAGDGILELWRPAAGGLIPYDGSQNLEVQANSNAAVYQDVATTPGTTFTWSFAHRGRSGNDSLAVKIGDINSLVVQQTVTTGNSAWQRYTGTYTVPAGQTTTRFKFEPVSWAGGNSSMGNLVDAVLICANPPAPTATNTPVPPTATNTSVPPTATNTAVPPTATNTTVPPTATNTPGALGSIGNKVWNDINANGILDSGEVGVPSVTVQLKDCSGNLLRSVTTDGNGNYGFNNQAAGCYLVTVVLPNGFQFSPKDQGGNDAVDSDVNPANGTTDVINLAAGQQIFTVDIGIYQLAAPTATPTNTALPPTATNTPVPPTATPTKTPLPTNTPTPAVGSIGDRVWKDNNRNGVQDSGEPGIGGVKVELWVDSNNDGTHDTLVGTTTTNSNGNYSFTGLDTSKRYVVKFSLPSCYSFTTPNVGSDVTDSDVTVFSYGGTDLISLAITAHTVDVDAGMYKCY